MTDTNPIMAKTNYLQELMVLLEEYFDERGNVQLTTEIWALRQQMETDYNLEKKGTA